MYKPLLDSLTIKSSGIDGLGLFAKEFIVRGTNLGMSHIKLGDKIYRTPLGGFINHSNNPNCFLNSNTHHPRGEQRELIAVKPIKVGEEITVYYVWGYEDAEEN